MTTRDETMPQGTWEFDESVAHVFADMLAQQTPCAQIEHTPVLPRLEIRIDSAHMITMGFQAAPKQPGDDPMPAPAPHPG